MFFLTKMLKYLWVASQTSLRPGTQATSPLFVCHCSDSPMLSCLCSHMTCGSQAVSAASCGPMQVLEAPPRKAAFVPFPWEGRKAGDAILPVQTFVSGYVAQHRGRDPHPALPFSRPRNTLLPCLESAWHQQLVHLLLIGIVLPPLGGGTWHWAGSNALQHFWRQKCDCPHYRPIWIRPWIIIGFLWPQVSSISCLDSKQTGASTKPLLSLQGSECCKHRVIKEAWMKLLLLCGIKIRLIVQKMLNGWTNIMNEYAKTTPPRVLLAGPFTEWRPIRFFNHMDSPGCLISPVI